MYTVTIINNTFILHILNRISFLKAMKGENMGWFTDCIIEQYIQYIQDFYLAEIGHEWTTRCNNVFPPQFTPIEWEPVYQFTNCFAYAFHLNIKPKYPLEYTPYYPKSSSLKEVTRYTLSYIQQIGIKYTPISSPIDSTKQFYTIGIFYSPIEEDVHFIRQDADNSWSHKMGWYSLPENLGTNLEEILSEFKKDTYLFCDFLKIYNPQKKSLLKKEKI